MKIDALFKITSVLFLIAFGMASSHAETFSSTVSDKYQQFYDAESVVADKPDFSRSMGVRAAYDKIISHLQNETFLRALKADGVDLLFRAAYDAAFYTFDKKYVADMELDLRLLKSKGGASERHYGDLYEMMIRARLFDLAESFAEKNSFPHEKLPSLDSSAYEGSGPSELHIDATGEKWKRSSITLSPGREIIVIGHPLCHFSQEATAYIESNQKLFKIFMAHSKWIMPQDGTPKSIVVSKWNASHPELPMSYIYRQDEFGQIDAWSTPNFYFFVDGRLVGHISGWPPSGGPEALIRELRKVGLLH